MWENARLENINGFRILIMILDNGPNLRRQRACAGIVNLCGLGSLIPSVGSVFTADNALLQAASRKPTTLKP